jgi:predicted O-methyltransferase YrrM
MIDLTTPNEWQHKDESLGGILFPWYTKSFLDELVTWDLKDKAVFEFGAGASTLWWGRRCKNVYAVESNETYLEAVRAKVDEMGIYYAGAKETYLKFITKPGVQFDIVVIDGEPIQWRDDCVKPALDCLKPGGKLIIDNWDQPSVGWLPSEETKALLAPYTCEIFPQEGHPDWKTAVFTIDRLSLSDPKLWEDTNYYIDKLKEVATLNQHPDPNQ